MRQMLHNGSSYSSTALPIPISKERHFSTMTKEEAKLAGDLQSRSSLGIKYPKWRDHPLHSTHLWLESKRVDDGSEGLWRIHDGLYDLSGFVNKHPGGSDWLRVTKGTDITEAFETHHLSESPNKLLSTFYVKKAKQPRNSPFTFHEDGFYRTLKKNVRENLARIPKKPATTSKIMTDGLFLSYVGLALMAAHLGSLTIGACASIALALTTVAAHNFVHQKDNFRMHYFDFTFMSSRQLRISHALSHHLYTNTINDLEISMFEPLFQYLPTEKPFAVRYLSWFYWPIVYAFLFFGGFLTTVVQKVIIGEKFTWEALLPLIVPTAMCVSTSQSFSSCILMYVWILIMGSIWFTLIAVNVGHHHPDVFHDGDATRSDQDMDWGIFQVDAIIDRKDVTGSHFLVLTNFGDHALHHLFPTIDHGLLQHLYPVFLETCKQFDIQWKLSSQLDTTIGQFKQLSRVTPNEVPPGKCKTRQVPLTFTKIIKRDKCHSETKRNRR